MNGLKKRASIAFRYLLAMSAVAGFVMGYFGGVAGVEKGVLSGLAVSGIFTGTLLFFGVVILLIYYVIGDLDEGKTE